MYSKAEVTVTEPHCNHGGTNDDQTCHLYPHHFPDAGEIWDKFYVSYNFTHKKLDFMLFGY